MNKKFLLFILVLLVFIIFLLSRQPKRFGSPEYGISFSTVYAARLGIDYRQAFMTLLDELNVKKVRLIAYWNEIEPTRGAKDFSRLDWLLNEVEKRDGEVILALGQKVPRVPECHIPEWVRGYDREVELLRYLKEIVERYKDRGVISSWQVENEPYLPTPDSLGSCPRFSEDLLEKELQLVRSLDSRPIVLTDSGELGWWLPAYKRADIFGTTMYRRVWAKDRYFNYPLPPQYFFIKENISRLIHGSKPTITVELQAEPWVPGTIAQTPVAERREGMNIETFRENIKYAERIGHSEIYLWGAEWWFWERLQGYPEFWSEAQELFNTQR